jgi:hypothetical protein
MPDNGQITGADNGVVGSWFIELGDDGGYEQTNNGPTPISGAMSRTRHQAKAPFRVRP